MENKQIKRGLAVSGGGNWGSFGAGTLAALNKNYDIAAGISTGALMAPLVMLNEYDRLKEAYTNTIPKDIFDLKWYKPKPINKKGKLNVWAIIWALLWGKESIATTNAMRKHIDKFFNSIDYANILREGKEVLVGTQNYQEYPSNIHYFSTSTEKFNSFKDWMWFSANYTFACSLVQKEWTPNPLFPNEKYMGQWSDGGATEVIPIDPLFQAGCTEIDVIIHRPIPAQNYQIGKIHNLIEYVENVVNAMRYDIEFEHLFETAEHMAKNHGVTTTLYFLPRKLGPTSLVFNKKQMTEWWEEGYATANDPKRIIQFKP
jgi:predicted acylesterase/phospholipase RssA